MLKLWTGTTEHTQQRDDRWVLSGGEWVCDWLCVCIFLGDQKYLMYFKSFGSVCLSWACVYRAGCRWMDRHWHVNGLLWAFVCACVRTSCGVSCSSGSSVASRMAVWSGVRPCHSDSSNTSRCVALRRRTNASSSSARFSSAASASAITWKRPESVNIMASQCRLSSYTTVLTHHTTSYYIRNNFISYTLQVYL